MRGEIQVARPSFIVAVDKLRQAGLRCIRTCQQAISEIERLDRNKDSRNHPDKAIVGPDAFLAPRRSTRGAIMQFFFNLHMKEPRI